MMRTVTTFALLIACGHGALAGDAAPRLKELVSVTSEIVRIGDLVENAGGAADIPIFRAPDLGQTGSVPVARIAEALRPHEVAGLDTAGLTEVVVTRLSRAISSKEITERISRALAGQFGFGSAQNLGVILDRDLRVLHVEASSMGELAVTRVNADPRNGRFDISFELPGSMAARRMPLRFTGTATETVETATLNRALRQGEVVKASDVSMERRPKSEAGNDSVAAAVQAVGMAVKAPMRSGQVLRQNDLIRPLVVQRNEPVTITYQVPGITLTVRGKATESGASGDMISVLNIQSNRTVQATVTGPGRVTMASNAPVVAAAVDATPEGEPSPVTQ